MGRSFLQIDHLLVVFSGVVLFTPFPFSPLKKDVADVSQLEAKGGLAVFCLLGTALGAVELSANVVLFLLPWELAWRSFVGLVQRRGHDGVSTF